MQRQIPGHVFNNRIEISLGSSLGMRTFDHIVALCVCVCMCAALCVAPSWKLKTHKGRSVWRKLCSGRSHKVETCAQIHLRLSPNTDVI